MSNKAFSMFKNDKELEDMEKTVETNSKKNLVIVPDGRYGLFKIQWDDNRSPIPEALMGHYTTQTRAEKDIKTYVANHRTTKSLEKKEREEAKDEMLRKGTNNEQSSEESQTEENSKEEEKEEVEEIEEDFPYVD